MTCALRGPEGVPPRPVRLKDGTWPGPLRFFGAPCCGYGCCLESENGLGFLIKDQEGDPWGAGPLIRSPCRDSRGFKRVALWQR